MSAHNAANQAFFSEKEIADPGSGGTIIVDRQVGVCNLASAGAEARALGRPPRAGIILTLYARTIGGTITLTVTGNINTTGDATYTFTAINQYLVLQSFETATSGTFIWRVISHDGIGDQSRAEAALINGLTTTQTELNSLAAANSTLTTGAGVGITSGTGTIYKTSVLKIGTIIHTYIYIDLTGLASISTDGDIIGVNGGGAAHIGRITTAQNGVIESMSVYCTETPAGGLADIDVFRATAATGVQDDAISGIAGQATTGAINITATATIKCATAVPAANDYLYLCAGASSGAGTYTAGKLLIHLIGY